MTIVFLPCKITAPPNSLTIALAVNAVLRGLLSEGYKPPVVTMTPLLMVNLLPSPATDTRNFHYPLL